MTAVESKTLLVPVDDYTACVVDNAFGKLSEYYIVPNVAEKEGGIVQLMDKNEQKKRAVQYNLPMLRSVMIKSQNGKFDIPEETQYPCFIKPNISMNSTKSTMMRCDNKEELEKVLSKYAQKGDFEMLVEEFADIKAEYSVLGVSTPDKTIAPCVFKVIAGGHRERKGVSIVGEAVAIDSFKEVISQCCEFIQGIGYTGLFDVDLLETVNGEVYFIELNFRAGASMHLFTKTGVNLPGILANSLLLNKPITDVCANDSVGKRFVSEKVLLEEYIRNDVNISKAKEMLNRADVYFIKDDLDKSPYKYFRKNIIVAALMKIPYYIRDKRMR